MRIKNFLLVIVVTFLFGLSSVYAMTEDELFSKLTQSYKVNGVTFQVTDSQKTLIERYLKQYDVSSEDADYVVSKMEAVFNVLKESGKKSFYDLSYNDKQRIISLVADVANHTSVDVAIVSGELVVYVPGSQKSEVFYQAPVVPNENGEITQTNRTLVFAGLGLFTAIGISLAFRKMKDA